LPGPAFPRSASPPSGRAARHGLDQGWLSVRHCTLRRPRRHRLRRRLHPGRAGPVRSPDPRSGPRPMSSFRRRWAPHILLESITDRW